MAKHYTSLAAKAAVVAIIAAAYSFTVSGIAAAAANDTKFCGCGPAKDQKNFPAYLADVLDEVVKRTPSQARNPVSGDLIFTATDPRNGGSGAAAATGTCFSGAVGSCSQCLSRARGFLKPCGAFACGGIRTPGECRFQFRQVK